MAVPIYDLSPKQAADLLGVHVHSIKRWAENGELPSWRTPGGWRRFSVEDIEAFRAKGVTTDDEPEAAAL